MNQKIGIVDVGGGYRGVYAAGVMDRLMLPPVCDVSLYEIKTSLFDARSHLPSSFCTVQQSIKAAVQCELPPYFRYSSHFGSLLALRSKLLKRIWISFFRLFSISSGEIQFFSSSHRSMAQTMPSATKS